MSLATLKKKSNRGVISGKGKDGFSIVGGYRNKGRVGETYENQYVRTLYKGIDAVGYGGNNNNYVITEIKPKITTNNYKIIKKPNLTTKGYILSRYEHPTPANNTTICSDSKCPQKWVKSFNNLHKTQSELIKKKRILSSSINSVKSKYSNSIKYNSNNKCNVKNDNNNILNYKDDSNCNLKSSIINGRRIYIKNYYKDLRGSIPSSEYLDCLLSNNCLPTPPCLQSFPMVLNQPGGCITTLYTPQEAIEAGYLPSNWMNCKETSSTFKNNPYC